MSFIARDEHVIVMQYSGFPGHVQLQPDDLPRLRDCGVRTVMSYLNWSWIETAMGVYDWSSIDGLVEPILKAGMKAIVKVYPFLVPTFLPEAWYQRNSKGEVLRNLGGPNVQGDIPIKDTGALSYWHPGAWDYHLGFIERACQHFDMPGVMCINIAPANGEGLLLGDSYYFDDWALGSFRACTGQQFPSNPTPGTLTLEWLCATIIPRQIETQAIFARHFGEYWTMLHHAFETIPSTGNWLIDDLYTALRQALTPAEHWGLCYTVFRPGETRGLWGPEQDVKRHCVKMLVAAEGCDGLNRNTERAIAMGMRGMFCAPVALYLGHNQMEPWMFQAIRDSIRLWEVVK